MSSWLSHFRNSRLQFGLTILLMGFFLCVTNINRSTSITSKRRLASIELYGELGVPLDQSMKQAGGNQTLNIFKNSYIHEPTIICNGTGNSPPLLLVLVKSDASNAALRVAIRETWGNVTTPGVKLIFLLGYYSITDKMVELESNLYKDVLQGEFIDIYQNNLNKTVMAFTWATENCLDTKFLLFVDDDFFVNLHNINRYLHSKFVRFNDTIFVGNLNINAVPFRNKSSKWYVSLTEYPEKFYPPYLSGGAILISMKLAKAFKRTFPVVRYIQIDDVFLGLTAKKLNILPSHDDRFSLDTSPMHLKDVFVAHTYGDHRQLIVIWEVFLASLSSKLKTNTDHRQSAKT